MPCDKRVTRSTLLTDEVAAREAVRALASPPVGSVSIVAKSHVSGLIDLAEAEAALDRLYDTSTLFVTRALIDRAILALRRQGVLLDREQAAFQPFNAGGSVRRGPVTAIKMALLLATYSRPALSLGMADPSEH